MCLRFRHGFHLRAHRIFKFPLPPRILSGGIHKLWRESVHKNGNCNALAVYATRLLPSSIPYLNLNTPTCHRSASPSLGDTRASSAWYFTTCSSNIVANASPIYFSFEYFCSRKGEDARGSYLLSTQVTTAPHLVPASRLLKALSESFSIISYDTSKR